LAKGWVREYYASRLKEMYERGEFWEIKRVMSPAAPVQ